MSKFSGTLLKLGSIRVWLC